MKKITITAGRDFTGNGRAIPEQEASEKLDTIREHLVALFGGYTETYALVEERSVIWAMYAHDWEADKLAIRAAQFVRQSLEQHSVVLEITDAYVTSVED